MESIYITDTQRCPVCGAVDGLRYELLVVSPWDIHFIREDGQLELGNRYEQKNPGYWDDRLKHLPDERVSCVCCHSIWLPDESGCYPDLFQTIERMNNENSSEVFKFGICNRQK